MNEEGEVLCVNCNAKTDEGSATNNAHAHVTRSSAGPSNTLPLGTLPSLGDIMNKLTVMGGDLTDVRSG